MRKSVVADVMALAENALRQRREFFRLRADKEKSRLHILLLEDVQNLRRELRVWAIVEADGEFIFRPAILPELVGDWKRNEFFASDEFRVCVFREVPPAPVGELLNAQYVAVALQIHVIAGRDAAQPRRRTGFTRQIPHRPQRAILGAQPPQRKSIQAQTASGAHLVQSGDGIEIPDYVPQIVLVNVTVVR